MLLRVSACRCGWASRHRLPSAPARRLLASGIDFSSDDYQLLHRSDMPTDLFQRSLPRLPIPTIENTCARYLNAQRPLLSADEFERTQSAALQFQQGAGRRLQDALRAVDKRNKHTSYISAPWFNMYLSDRRPLVLNYNPFLSFIDDPTPAQNAPVLRAANMTVAALRFKRSLDAGVLAPEVFHLNAAKSDTPGMHRLVRMLPRRLAAFGAYYYQAYPLDMSQFASLFASTRVPRSGCDELVQSPGSRHVLAIRNGNLYTFDGLDATGAVRPSAEIHGCVRQISEDRRPANSAALGYLTAENRDTWAGVRQHLIDSGNGEYMQLIDSALFVLVLDDTRIDDDPLKAFRLFLHGDAANRWFDKSFSLMFSGEGKAAINFEHAWGDGVAVLRFFNEIHKDAAERRYLTPESVPAAADVRRMDDWKLDARASEAIQQARTRYHSLVGSMDVGMLRNPTIGKALCKQKRISPDALMQMGFQVAFHRMTGGTTASYESCSTSAFRHGRTETIRPATDATLALSRAINAQQPPAAAELLQLVRACSKAHGELTVNAAKGQGCDRHLFALRLLAEKLDEPMPDIYTDPAYARFNKFRISTSTLSSPAAETGGFGAVEPDGFGIGYMIKDQELGSLVTAYPANSDLSGYMQCLESTFKDLQAVIAKS